MKTQGYLIITFLMLAIPGWSQILNDARCTLENCALIVQSDNSSLKRIIKTNSSSKKLSLDGAKSFGFGTSTNNLSIPFNYDDAQPFYNGYAIVTADNKQGIIDSTGKIVIPLNYKSLSNVSEGRIFFSLNGHTLDGMLDLKGNQFSLDPQMGVVLISNEHPKLTFVADSASLTYTSTQIIPHHFSEGLAVINNKVMDREGKFLFTSEYVIHDCKDGMMRIQKKSKNSFLFGFMNTKGETVIEPVYSLAQDFVQGKSVVCIRKSRNQIVKIIDKKGMVLKTIEKER